MAKLQMSDGNDYWFSQMGGQKDSAIKYFSDGGASDAQKLQQAGLSTASTYNTGWTPNYSGLLYAKKLGLPGASDEFNRLIAPKAPAAAAPTPPPYGGWTPSAYTPFNYGYQPMSAQLPTQNFNSQQPSQSSVPMGGYQGSLPGQGMGSGMNNQSGGLLTGMLNKSNFLPHF